MAERAPAPEGSKSKLRTIMEAASALTALGDEEETGPWPQSNQAEAKDGHKRYIPEHKKPDAALTFPEKLMNLMRFAQQQDDAFCIAWLADGKSFVIRNPEEFTRQVLPKFFKATKFSSFTRKLYRWGFRQVNRGIGPDDPIIFGNEHFQRDCAEEMSKMRSVTAASSRKADAQTVYGSKRTLDRGGVVEESNHHKRALLGHLLQQQKVELTNTSRNPNMYLLSSLPHTGGAVSLTSALRPGLGLGGTHHHRSLHSPHHAHLGVVLPAMVSKHMDILGHQQNGNSLISNYMPHQNLGSIGRHGQQQCYSSTASTADIVNAAISALRFAS